MGHKLRLAICEGCGAQPVCLTPAQARNLPDLAVPLLCWHCKGRRIAALYSERWERVHVLYECGGCGGVMLSTNEGAFLRVTVTTKCEFCKETNMDMVGILDDEQAEAWLERAKSGEKD